MLRIRVSVFSKDSPMIDLKVGFDSAVLVCRGKDESARRSVHTELCIASKSASLASMYSESACSY